MAWGARNLISTQDFERAARSLGVVNCVEINQCVGCTRQFFTKIFFSATTRPTWLGRAARKRHRHAIILISTQVVNQKNVLWDHLSCRDLCGNQIYGAFVTLHAIDATPARWRGDAGSSPLDRARTAESLPRNDLVKNCRVPPTHWLISTQEGAMRRVAVPGHLVAVRVAGEPRRRERVTSQMCLPKRRELFTEFFK